MPPPATTEKELGETRIVNFTVTQTCFQRHVCHDVFTI